MPVFGNGRNNGRDENPINQMMIAAIEAELAAMSPEERAAYEAMDEAADNLMAIQLRKEYGIEVQFIKGDRHHIVVDGQKMGYAEFNNYMQARQILDNAIAHYENGDDDDGYYDDDDEYYDDEYPDDDDDDDDDDD